MQRGNWFESIEAACEVVKAFVLDQGESFLTMAPDKKHYIIHCEDRPCNFRIRATLHKKVKLEDLRHLFLSHVWNHIPAVPPPIISRNNLNL
jgi:hypothetical protein